MLHYTVNQRPHWACRQYGHSGGTRGWLGVERCQLCLQDTSHSAKRHRRAAVGHWVSLCVKCCRMVDSVPRWRLSPTNWPIQSDHLSIADYDDTAFRAGTLTCTFLESRSMTVEHLI
jgi:hypothetical protein